MFVQASENDKHLKNPKIIVLIKIFASTSLCRLPKGGKVRPKCKPSLSVDRFSGKLVCLSMQVKMTNIKKSLNKCFLIIILASSSCADCLVLRKLAKM